jgi:hypothetical protein
MWRALMDWLPDLRVGAFEIRDLVSLVVGGLGAFLAYLAIKPGKEQAAISKRPAEIAETQHQILQEQLARRAVADMSITQGIPIRDGRVLARVYVENNGSKSISEYNWEFIVPEEYRDYLTIFWWKIFCEDGSFPNPKDFGYLNAWAVKARAT